METRTGPEGNLDDAPDIVQAWKVEIDDWASNSFDKISIADFAAPVVTHDSAVVLILAFHAVARTCAATGRIVCGAVSEPCLSMLYGAHPQVVTQDSELVASNVEV